MSKYARYPEYKDSGVPWLGEIPSHWQVKRMKFLLAEKLKYGANESAESEDTTQPRYIRITDINENGFLKEDTFKSLDFDKAKDYLLCKNDILLARSGATVGKSFIYREDLENSACYAGYLIRARFFESEINSFFINYFMQSNSYWDWIKSVNIQATIQNVSAEKYNDFSFSIPNKFEQDLIVSYLEYELSKIDALIDKQQLLLDKLAEQRSAVITQAVTKGLNPNAEMKDSGVAWLGDVPSHWQVTPFKLMMDSLIDYRGKTPEKTSDGVFLITARNIKKGGIDYTLSQEFISEDSYDEVMRRGLPKLGHVLMTTEAPLGEVAQIDRIDVALAQRVLKFDGKKEKLDNSFLKNFILSKAFQTSLYKFATGSTALGIKSERLTYLKLLIPPMDEQIQIVEFIDQETQKIDQMTETVNRTIERLKEYRSTLITQAVTGKIDVRHHNNNKQDV